MKSPTECDAPMNPKYCFQESFERMQFTGAYKKWDVSGIKTKLVGWIEWGSCCKQGRQGLWRLGEGASIQQSQWWFFKVLWPEPTLPSNGLGKRSTSDDTSGLLGECLGCKCEGGQDIKVCNFQLDCVFQHQCNYLQCGGRGAYLC